MASSDPSHDQWPPLLASHESKRHPKPLASTGDGHGGVGKVAATMNNPTTPGDFYRPQATASYISASMASTTRPPDPSDLPVLRPSFASVARPKTSFRFPPIQLPARQQATKDGKPMVAFTASEIQPGIQRLQHSLIAKFSSGRPPIDDVRHHFSETWGLADKSTIGAMDARHILIILPTADESNRILAHPLRKVCQSLFRLFRWTPDFHRRKEPTTITTWIKLPGLPSHLFDQGYISSITSTFGRFIAIDEKTRMFSNPSFARACMELDLSKPFPGEVWVSLGPDNGFWQPITYENKLLYCSKCKLHGHDLSTCRRNKPSSTTRETITPSHLQADNPQNQHQAATNQPKEWTLVTKKKGRVDSKKEQSAQQPKLAMPSNQENADDTNLVNHHAQEVEQNDSLIGESSELPNQDRQLSQNTLREIISENQPIQAVDHNDLGGVDGGANTQEHTEEKHSNDIPEEIAQKISSYGSVRFYCEELGGQINAKDIYMQFKTGNKDDNIIFQILDGLVNGQAQQEVSGISIEEGERDCDDHEVGDVVDPSMRPTMPSMQKSRNKKKGSRSSARFCPKKKDPNFV